MNADVTKLSRKCRQLLDVVICDYHPGSKWPASPRRASAYQIAVTPVYFVQISPDTTKEMVLNAIDNQSDAYITKPVTRTLRSNA